MSLFLTNLVGCCHVRDFSVQKLMTHKHILFAEEFMANPSFMFHCFWHPKAPSGKVVRKTQSIKEQQARERQNAWTRPKSGGSRPKSRGSSEGWQFQELEGPTSDIRGFVVMFWWLFQCCCWPKKSQLLLICFVYYYAYINYSQNISHWFGKSSTSISDSSEFGLVTKLAVRRTIV